MSDQDSELLKAASAAVTGIDIGYRALSIDEKEELKPHRDQAYSDYSAARLNLLKTGVLADERDVAEMQQLASEIEAAAEKQQLIASAISVSGKLAKFV